MYVDESSYIFKNCLKFMGHKNTCSMKLLELVPWWTETGREGRRWSLIWCRQWGRCWSSWAHRHCSCLQTIFSPDCRLHISWQCSNVCSSSSLSPLSPLPLSAVAPTLPSLARTVDSSHLKLCHNQIFYSNPLRMFSLCWKNPLYYFQNVEMSSNSLPGAFK